jgi:TRAP-type C4-dicarboxylate transport system permease small subunit
MSQSGRLSKLKFLKNYDFFIAGIALCILVVVTFLGVIMRYAVNRPFTWQQETQLACIVWIVLWGAGGAFRYGSHVAIEFIVDKFPEKLQKVFYVVILLISVFVLAYLLIQSCILLAQFNRSGRATEILKIPLVCIYWVIPAGLAITIFNYIHVTFKALVKKDLEEVIEGEAAG